MEPFDHEKYWNTVEDEEIGEVICYDREGALNYQITYASGPTMAEQPAPPFPHPSCSLRQEPRERELYTPDPVSTCRDTKITTCDERDMFGSSPLSSLPPSPALSPSLAPHISKVKPQALSAATKNPDVHTRSLKKRKNDSHDDEQGDDETQPTVGKVKKVYASWACRPVPPNIMDMLRFDHPPEIMNAPRAVLPDYPEEAVYQPQVRRHRPAKSTSQPNDSAKRKLQRPRNAVHKTQGQVNTVDDDIKIVPLPSKLVLDIDGIPSSKFSAVLRILAGLPRPRPKRPKEVQSKPEVSPPVWAESRQELCEALPYYRSFQSGLYMHSRVAFGYLLEAYPAPRDVWVHNGKVVISHGGGQCIRTTDPRGQQIVTLQADQSRSDARVDTLMNAHERRTPIVLIAGAGYDFLPWRLDCAYVVLGWYWISMTWVEAEPAVAGLDPPAGRDFFHRYKIRFDWVQSQGEPWWHTEIDPQTRTSAFSASHSDADEVGHHAAGPMTPPRERSLAGPSAEDRSPKRDITALLNPAGLLTPPLSSPTESFTSHSDSAEKELAPQAAGGSNEIIPSLLEDRLLTCELAKITASHDAHTIMPSTLCAVCDHPIVQIYQEGAICLRHDCSAFFMLLTEFGLMPIPPGFSLTSNEAFLRPIDTPQDIRLPYDVIPPEPLRRIPQTGEDHQVGAGSRTLGRGWVCRRCGRANCRYRWEVWECRNCGHQFGHLDPDHTIPASALVSANPAIMGDAKILPTSDISVDVKVMTILGCVLCIYDLASAGKVYHLVSSQSVIADKLFEEYQREAASGGWFQRRPIKAVCMLCHHSEMLECSHALMLLLWHSPGSKQVKGQLLAQHFAVNSGASYKYIVDTMSFPFENSPPCVIQALNLMTERVRIVLEEEVRFNEILSVMYREGQKMSWHDDGEKGLGHVVASLSLGSPAIMSFRLKRPRVEPNEHFKTGIPVNRHSPPTALSLTLSHGDILIMQGREIQRRYDHRVIPQGLRVAATARVIGPP
ncbi:hypothetical protein IAU59_001620 [Kwoniella sp. CBS 9459]